MNKTNMKQWIKLAESLNNTILYVYVNGNVEELDTADELAMQRFNNRYGFHADSLDDIPVERGVQKFKSPNGDTVIVSADPHALAAEAEGLGESSHLNEASSDMSYDELESEYPEIATLIMNQLGPMVFKHDQAKISKNWAGIQITNQPSAGIGNAVSGLKQAGYDVDGKGNRATVTGAPWGIELFQRGEPGNTELTYIFKTEEDEEDLDEAQLSEGIKDDAQAVNEISLKLANMGGTTEESLDMVETRKLAGSTLLEMMASTGVISAPQVAAMQPEVAVSAEPETEENINYSQTKRVGDSTVTVSANAHSMDELHTLLKLAGIDSPQAPPTPEDGDCGCGG